MKKQFVTYEIAIALKKLGFNEECFGYFDIERTLEIFEYYDCDRTNLTLQSDFGGICKECTALLWQQAIDYLRELGIVVEVWYDNTQNDGFPWLYEIYVNNEQHEHSGDYFDNFFECRSSSILKAINLYKSI